MKNENFFSEDYLQSDTTTSCSSLTLYNWNKCYEETISNTIRYRSRQKTCEYARNPNECKIIAESRVSDPDERVCDYDNGCFENYKYCSDYRGTDSDICQKIKPYDESGKNIDITSKCQYTSSNGCERVSKECDDSVVISNSILCSLISHKIQDDNVKYCAFISNNCLKQYKNCESYTGSSSSICNGITPKNYLTAGICRLNSSNHCVNNKKECDLFNVDDYKYLCKNMPNCTYSSIGGIGVSVKEYTP